MVDFGNRLRILRKKQHWTQEGLAGKIGVSKALISAYETGIRMPSYENLLSIAHVFHVSTDYLLGNDRQSDLDFSGLTQAQASAIVRLINAIREG